MFERDPLVIRSSIARVVSQAGPSTHEFGQSADASFDRLRPEEWPGGAPHGLAAYELGVHWRASGGGCTIRLFPATASASAQGTRISARVGYARRTLRGHRSTDPAKSTINGATDA
jgi:hypothetical protein